MNAGRRSASNLALMVLAAAIAVSVQAVAGSEPRIESTGIFSKQIRTEIEFDASPDRVWKVLMEFERFPDWNPFIRKISGEPQVGERLEVHLADGKSEMTFRPAVLVVEPAREFRWRGSVVIRGIFDGEHFFLIEPLGAGHTRFVQGENFSGMVVPFLGGVIGRAANSFAEMNQALKKQVEQGESKRAEK